MKIHVVCSSRELFGADRSALRLARVLRRLGHETTLVVPEHRPDLGLDSLAASMDVAVLVRPVAIATSAGVELGGLLGARRDRADLVVVNSTAILAAAVQAPRRIVVVREWLDPTSARHRAIALRHRIGADAVVGVSGGVMRQWRSIVRGPRHQHVVHNWLAPEVLADMRERRAATRSDGIACIGRFNAWKGQEALAAAYREAFAGAETRPRLRFVGAQPEEPFAGRAERVAAQGRDLWTVEPFVRDPAPVMAAAELVVVPSQQPEPFGTVMLEALACGARVVAYEGGGPDDLATAFPVALAVVPRRAGALSDALRRWWEDREPFDVHAAEVDHVIDERYSEAAAERRWLSILGPHR